MATKALRNTSRAVRYFPSLRAVVNQMVRNLQQGAALSTSSPDTALHGDGSGGSVFNRRRNGSTHRMLGSLQFFRMSHSLRSIQADNWPDARLGPFAPKDPNFPLPGNVGIDLAQLPQPVTTDSGLHRRTVAEALLDLESEDVRKAVVMDTYVKDISEDSYEESAQTQKSPSAAGTVECSVQQCPGFLHYGFMELFPDIGVHVGQLTVVSISQRTENDMSAWSPDVEDERDNLMANFVESAKEICNSLLAAGYWADFIDPSSGTAFFGPHTNSTLFETDERYNHLGFSIMDLGCCKVISHHLWGSHAFVGTIFTNAPANSDVLGNSLQQNK